MAEQQKEQRRKSTRPEPAELYGLQGNQGQYGLGQYDSDGKPDPHGEQGRQIGVDPEALKPKNEREEERALDQGRKKNDQAEK
jgi:hypothetical protein